MLSLSCSIRIAVSLAIGANTLINPIASHAQFLISADYRQDFRTLHLIAHPKYSQWHLSSYASAQGPKKYSQRTVQGKHETSQTITQFFQELNSYEQTASPARLTDQIISINNQIRCQVRLHGSNRLLSPKGKILSLKTILLKINSELKHSQKLLKTLQNPRLFKKLKAARRMSTITKSEIRRCMRKESPYLVKTCSLQVQNQTISVPENASAQITLHASLPADTTSCGQTLSFQITQAPQFGTLSGSAPQLQFQWSDHRGTQDQFTFQVSDELGNSALATVSLHVITQSASFAGYAQSLAPYREALSPSEVRHVLGRVYGGSPTLTQIGISQGLDALVDALLNTPDDPTVPIRALQLAQESNQIFAGRWGIYGFWHLWLHQLRYGNPLREKMARIWDDHLAINLSEHSNSLISHNFIKNHFDVLHEHALGNFEDMVQSLLFDGATAHSLNLFQNHAFNLNENFPREFFELLLLGVTSPVSGERNYKDDTEGDVRNAARALSGFYDYAFFHPWEGLAWSSEWRRDLWYADPITIFPGKPYATTASFDPGNFSQGHPFVHYILYQHPGASEYIAYTLFTRLVHLHPSPQVIQELADDLLINHYNIKQTVGKLFRSSAMFSVEARNACYSSPLDSFITMLRVLDIPLFKATDPQTSTEYDLYSDAAAYLDASGETLGGSPTVFGQGTCGGHQPGKAGEGLIGAELLLNRENFLNIFLTALDSAKNLTSPPFDWESLFPDLSELSAEQIPDAIVNLFAARMNIELSEAEKDLFHNYMTHRIEGNTSINYWTVPVTWNTTDPNFSALVSIKAAGLIQAFFLHTEFNVK